MRINETEMPLAARDFFLLLRALLTPEQGDVDLAAQRSQAPPMSEGQALTRAYLLTEQLDIPEGHEPQVAREFADIIGRAEDARRIPRASLAQAVSAFTRRSDGAARPLRWYEEKTRNLLRHAATFAREEPDTRPLTRLWPREIIESPAWNCIQSPVPGVPDLPLEDTWVDLTLRETRARNSIVARELESRAWDELSFDSDWIGISLRQALSRVHGLAVIVGLPGAGKSTLIKWLARHLVTEPDCPFGIPVVISLRRYAQEKARRPELTLLEYFLASRGVRDRGQLRRWRAVAEVLLDPPESESGVRETFLWLLDGWDEMPPEMRGVVLPELQALASQPCIVTTRHSGDPLGLPARQFYEIQGLKHGAALEFAHRWLVRTGNEVYYAAIENRLEESADLRRMARSPFLLTLICALAANPTRTTGGGIPPRRGGVLRETLGLVFEQHNADAKQSRKFGSRDREEVSRFAFWLLADAPGGPRYVFDAHDYERAGAREGVFESLLAPSRLIARPVVDSTDYQFLHASFQEYLAAQNLLRTPGEIPRDGALLRNQVWKEVARFLAETATPGTDAWEVLWREARRAVQTPDKFGIIAARVSMLLAAADERDGGRRLLGVDLRDHLWRVMKRHAARVPTPLLEAFLELDATDFARRILDQRIRTGKNSIEVSWLRQVSIFDLEMLFTDHQKYRKVLALPEVATFCPDLPDWVVSERAAPNDPHEEALLGRVEQALSSRDAEAMKAAVGAILKEGLIDLAIEAVQLPLRLPPAEAGAFLLDLITSDTTDVLTRGKAVSSLMRLNDRAACNQVMAFLASRDADDPAVFAILGNLEDYALNERETRLVQELLRRSQNPDTRVAAAELLAQARARGVAADLTFALAAEPDEEVRLAILTTLAELADESAVNELWALRESAALQSDDEWSRWFEAVLSTLKRSQLRVAALGGAPASDALTLSVREWAARALYAARDGDHSRLAPAVCKFPGVLGKTAASQLMSVAGGEGFPEELREAAIHGLSQVGGADVIQFLSGLARARKRSVTDLLKQAACDSLGVVSPDALSTLKTRQAEVSMAGLAFRHHMLFVAPGGASGVMSTQPSTGEHAMTEPAGEIIKIVLFSANPADTGRLKLDEELRAITQKIRDSTNRDMIRIVPVVAVRPDDLLLAMNEHEPHVVQFSGHGNEGEGILVCDEQGRAKVIDADALTALFESTERNVQVVVLNACYTRPQAAAIATVVPCVIGMKDTIGDRAARVFAASFYRALGFGRSVAVAFKQGLTALRLEGIKQTDRPDLITREGVRPEEIFPVNPTVPTPR